MISQPGAAATGEEINHKTRSTNNKKIFDESPTAANDNILYVPWSCSIWKYFLLLLMNESQQNRKVYILVSI